ncbi:MAG: hypothetical protein N2323_07410, partial [candidate division WOR-3 bacterium]|nr:hypothetical protein [candidate division WOR-3 bacterium]
EYGITFSIFYFWNFFTYDFQFAYLNKDLSPYTYYQKRDFPYFDNNIKINLADFTFQINYLSFFNYQYDSFPHNLSFIIKKEEKTFAWQFQINRYLKLTRIKKWSNSFLITKNFKNLNFSLFISDNYYQEKRKYLIIPKIKMEIKNLETLLAYYINHFNWDFKSYHFEEEILAEHSLKENIKNRFLFQITCNFNNFLLKLKFSFDKEVDYLTYLSIKV